MIKVGKPHSVKPSDNNAVRANVLTRVFNDVWSLFGKIVREIDNIKGDVSSLKSDSVGERTVKNIVASGVSSGTSGLSRQHLIEPLTKKTGELLTLVNGDPVVIDNR